MLQSSCPVHETIGVLKLLAYFWTSPNTLLGLLIALPDLLTQRRFQRVAGVIEIEGPWVRLLLRRAVLLGSAWGPSRMLIACAVTRPASARWSRWKARSPVYSG